jgi:hypothetical protein
VQRKQKTGFAFTNDLITRITRCACAAGHEPDEDTDMCASDDPDGRGDEHLRHDRPHHFRLQRARRLSARTTCRADRRAPQTSGIHLAFNMPLAKLYTNSLLSTLNSRARPGQSDQGSSDAGGGGRVPRRVCALCPRPHAYSELRRRSRRPLTSSSQNARCAMRMWVPWRVCAERADRR